jgi:hypothetical protein
VGLSQCEHLPYRRTGHRIKTHHLHALPLRLTRLSDTNSFHAHAITQKRLNATSHDGTADKFKTNTARPNARGHRTQENHKHNPPSSSARNPSPNPKRQRECVSPSRTLRVELTPTCASPSRSTSLGVRSQRFIPTGKFIDATSSPRSALFPHHYPHITPHYFDSIPYPKASDLHSQIPLCDLGP